VLNRRDVLTLSATAGLSVVSGLGSATPAAAATAPALTAVPGGTLITLASGRQYWLAGATGGLTSRPAIVGLTFSGHDAGWLDGRAWVTGHPETTGWHRHALSAGYTLILVEPVRGGWNVGTGVDDPNPNGWPGTGQDDVAAILAAVADAGERTPIDPARTFVAGGSAGGAMAVRMSVEHPRVFAAGAAAAGWVPYRYPARPWDCRFDCGSQDLTVPIRGGKGANGYTFPPLYDAAAKAPRGSRVTTYLLPTGGHAIPGWWAAAIWGFFTVERLRP
jgi:poly(3-hydroxybutyrate) depolymerase